MSHSKRNTTRPVFTSYERALAKSNWASSSARLNRDSFLPFGSCGLCLEPAREPVSCPRGDIFCRECVLANLLAQRKELKRADKARQAAVQEGARIRALEDEEERERAVRDFELTQAGLTGAAARKKRKRGTDATDAADGVLLQLPETLLREESENGEAGRAGTKRKFALDHEEMRRHMDEDKARARKAIESEKSSKALLPSFWTPSLTPSAQDSKLPPVTKQTKTRPMCPASMTDDPHDLSLTKLITIHFEEEAGSQDHDTKRRICPSCRKVLSNSLSPVMADKCGHVLCLSCVKQFLLPTAEKTKTKKKKKKKPNSDDDDEEEEEEPIRCFVCEAPAAVKASRSSDAGDSLPTGFVKLKSEGTGFSARGSNTVEKSGTVFQC